MSAPPVEARVHPITKFKSEIDTKQGEFAAALPAHIPVERFTRVVVTAVTSNPDLLTADRRSLFIAAVKAASDGLLPDGREGAFVIFKGKAGVQVQWMPMIAGILKKIRNSGELLSIAAYVAYEKDSFHYELGENERIEHTPFLDGDRGNPRLVYAIARTKDGGIYRELMTVAEVEQVRAVSRARDSGPWTQWWGEMAKKTVLRRLAKRLPISTDLDDLIRRDDALYDFDGASDKAASSVQRPAKLAGRLDALASQGRQNAAHALTHQAPVTIDHDPDTGEVMEHAADAAHEAPANGPAVSPKRAEGGAPHQGRQKVGGDAQHAPAQASPPADDDAPFPGDEPPARPAARAAKAPDVDPREEAYRRGQKARRDGLNRRALPGEYRDDDELATAWQDGFESEGSA